MQTNTDNLKNWLEDLLKERINKDIYIIKIKGHGDKYYWQISFKNKNSSIKMPIIKELYQLGLQDNLSFIKWSPPKDNFKNFKFELSLPGKKFIEQDFFNINGSSIELRYDILGLIYWMLCRCEEVNTDPKLLDKYNRFLSFRSHSDKHDYLKRPIVDEWILFIKELTKILCPNLKLIESKFEIIVTHDVDHPLKNTLHRPKELIKNISKEIFIKKNIKTSIFNAYYALNSKNILYINDPFNKFEWMMDQSEKRNYKSTFNFIFGRTSKNMDGSYEITDKSIIDLIKKISYRGHKIGLHFSFNSFNNKKAITIESEKFFKFTKRIALKQSVWGSRMHFLKWKWPETALYLANTNIDFDSSLCYADKPGFRCGTCHPYKMYDPVSQKSIDLIQAPLILMECSMFSNKYMGLQYSKEAYDQIKELKKACREVEGKFVILWHNTQLISKFERNLFIDCIT